MPCASLNKWEFRMSIFRRKTLAIALLAIGVVAALTGASSASSTATHASPNSFLHWPSVVTTTFLHTNQSVPAGRQRLAEQCIRSGYRCVSHHNCCSGVCVFPDNDSVVGVCD